METSFSKIRKELDDWGYSETLKPDCLSLVTRIFSDLKVTTENLAKYVTISKQALEERDYLKLGAEPYKCDNAKLVRECNELHLAFIQFKEQHEKVQKDLKTKISVLEGQLTDSGIERHKLLQKIGNLESELNRTAKGDKLKSQSQTKSASFHLNSVMANSDQKIATLSKELRKLREEQLQCIKSNEFFKAQLQNRDEEIKRLNSLLEGGRPTKALSKDCCYKNIDNKIGSLQDEINGLKREKITLQNELKEALAKQHEAMRRAIHLADRNKQLENEMKDIDQIALAVEAECNDTVKNNAEKVTRLQDKINESIITIQNLERDNAKLITEKKELSAELDAIRLEKKTLQTLLETEAEDKKRLTDRINNFTIIENDLNKEIDRLLKISGQQRIKIAELECQVTTTKLKASGDLPKFHTKQLSHPSVDKTSKKSESIDHGIKSKQSVPKVLHKKTCKKSSLSKQSSSLKDIQEDRRTSLTIQKSQTCCCEAGGCVRSMKELLDKEMELRQEQAMQQIESLKQEKDYYMKEYHKVVEQMRSFPGPEKSNRLQDQTEGMLGRIKEKDQMISTLQSELRTLSNEKYSLTSRLESISRGQSEIEVDGICQKTGCKRKARELEIHREEVKHLERENDSLKSKIQALTESSVFDQDRMKKAFREMEEHIRVLENERRDLVVGQTTSRSNVTQLEEERSQIKEQLRVTVNELNTLKANYNQLKLLQDQSDRALTEAQSQLLRAETELQSYQSKVSLTHRESAGHEREVARLQGDVEVMKLQLSKIDKEKDELLNIVDEKTEKIDLLENQLREKKNLMSSLEGELKELKRKLGKVTDETSSQEMQLRSSKQELSMLQRDYESEKKLKESALQENKRLLDDIASLTCDVRDTRKELEISKRQVDDLTRQLQHYVAEVKRTEDLISQKELERTEILDQFKCLSEEANILESSNHTLENEATQSKVQLSVALDHASDLERKLENQDSIIKSYERQISELTTQVASLEIQMKQGDSQSERVSTELKRLKDLCIRLDNEKDELRRELQSREDQKGMVERNVDMLSRENKELRRALDKDKNDLEGLEKLLNEARQEVVEQRLLNQDLQSEVVRMKAKINDMQEGLSTATEQLDLYQEKAFEYIQQNKQLRREIANERFTRAREGDCKRYPSL
ncbi:centrosomal protein 135kDa isoform X2 [Leptinotarsa decemlineata]|uniref:centrosomal protein 135kDa isoform X2 n=1 Tax=Leptinotarsa decemlineata TaxID=7539 RepID=UPI003D30C5C5